MGLTSDLGLVCVSIYTGRLRILLSLMPVLIIGLASKHLYDCPKEPMVPIYLLVGGVICLILQILPYLYCNQPPHRLCRIFNTLLLVFCPIWFITGSVFVYMAYKPNYDFRLSDDYCERIIYEFAFWITNAIYIGIPILLLGFCFKRLETSWKKRARKQCYIRTVS